MSVRQQLSPCICPGAPEPAGPYSHLLRVGDLVFSSGFGPQVPGTNWIPDGIEAQTEQVLDNLAVCLAEVGLTLDHVVRITAHLANLQRDFAAYNTVMARRITAPYPVRTTVGSQLMGFLVELDVVAVARAGRS